MTKSIVKGLSLGVAIFVVGSVIYVAEMMQSNAARATGTTAILGWTLQNPLYWCGLVVALVVGCGIVLKNTGART